MKCKEKLEARKLRKETGISIREISEKLGVAKSSVSLWVRDVILTKKQKKELHAKNPIYNGHHKGALVRKKQAEEKRNHWQSIGRKKAMENEKFRLLCALYWAEGSKGRNSMVFANTDKNMLKLFSKSLEECFENTYKKIKIRVYYHLGGLDISEIHAYWMNELDLQPNNIQKAIICNHPHSKGYRKNKHLYGCCHLIIHSTQLVQTIFGGIKQIGKIENESLWL